MKLTNISFRLAFILSITTLFLSFTNTFASDSKTYTGRVDDILQNKIVIDDFEMTLDTKINNIQKGDLVEFTTDDQARIINIQKITSDYSKFNEEPQKVNAMQYYKVTPRKSMTSNKTLKAKTSKKGGLKKRNNVWKNY